jgi:hypothetical protein
MRADIKKMWIMIVSEALINFYSYAYSQVEYFAPSADCHFIQSSYVYWNVSTIINRLIICDIWAFPIIYMLWPMDRTWYGA